MKTSEPLIRRGQVVPPFTLPDTQGRSVRRSAYRGIKHLVLVFLPSADDAARAYLRALAAGYAAIRAQSGEALAIARGEAATLASANDDLALPFPLLVDSDGQVSRRFVPAGAHAGVFVTDRYGELYYTALSADSTGLPPIEELQSWLTAIDHQCAI